MKNIKIILIILFTVVVVFAAVFFLIGYFKPKPGGIMVNSTPGSSVYINGNLVGKTPFEGTYIAGQINLKLVPEISDQNLIAYETKVNLISGIQTVVRREFGVSEEESSGDVISFEKIGGETSSLVVISNPDNSQVAIDGETQGFSPYGISSISPGSHNVTVKASGYSDRSMSIKTKKGYRLTIYAKLAKSQEEIVNPTPSPTPQAENKTYIVIMETPTGFLRMRTKPGTGGDEIAELKPGEKYLFLEADAASGWYRIQYKDAAPGLPDGISGWVSNQYSQISTSSGTPK